MKKLREPTEITGVCRPGGSRSRNALAAFVNRPQVVGKSAMDLEGWASKRGADLTTGADGESTAWRRCSHARACGDVSEGEAHPEGLESSARIRPRRASSHGSAANRVRWGTKQP